MSHIQGFKILTLVVSDCGIGVSQRRALTSLLEDTNRRREMLGTIQYKLLTVAPPK